MTKLALFDIDFTLTKKETLLQLYMYMFSKNKKLIKYLPRVIYSGLFYILGINNEKKTKEIFLKFINNMSEVQINNICIEFYHDVLSKILYKDGIEMIRKLKDKGYMVILISASPEFYIKTLYNIPCVDKIIGTKIKVEDGIYKNKIIGENCKGVEKTNRLSKYLNKNDIVEVDYKNSYMFSDSLSDLPLLNLVGNPILINYKKKTTFKNMMWY